MSSPGWGFNACSFGTQGAGEVEGGAAAAVAPAPASAPAPADGGTAPPQPPAPMDLLSDINARRVPATVEHAEGDGAPTAAAPAPQPSSAPAVAASSPAPAAEEPTMPAPMDLLSDINARRVPATLEHAEDMLPEDGGAPAAAAPPAPAAPPAAFSGLHCACGNEFLDDSEFCRQCGEYTSAP